jgi:hypothetical protein
MKGLMLAASFGIKKLSKVVRIRPREQLPQYQPTTMYQNSEYIKV